MIAADLAQRYAQGESLSTLAREYHLAKCTVAKTVRAMGGEIRPAGGGHRGRIVGPHAAEMRLRKAREKKLATGEFCQRCEILLRFDPGQNGYCGECFSEVREGAKDVSTQATPLPGPDGAPRPGG